MDQKKRSLQKEITKSKTKPARQSLMVMEMSFSHWKKKQRKKRRIHIQCLMHNPKLKTMMKKMEKKRSQKKKDSWMEEKVQENHLLQTLTNQRLSQRNPICWENARNQRSWVLTRLRNGGMKLSISGNSLNFMPSRRSITGICWGRALRKHSWDWPLTISVSIWPPRRASILLTKNELR